MSLDLSDFLPFHVDHLNGARSIVFGNTGEQSSTTVQELNLRNGHTSLISGGKGACTDCLDSLIITSSVNNRLRVRLGSHAGELEVFNLVNVLWVLLLRVFFVGVELPAEDTTVPTSGDEARVIIKPVKASDDTTMHLVNHITILSSVEFVDIDIGLGCTSEEMATVREPDLSATLDSDGLE